MTGKLSPFVRDKLAKLLPLLSSDREGERVGTVAAIDRVLKSAKLDWYDLAAQITVEPVGEQPQRQGRAAAEMDSDDLIDLIEAMRDSGVNFSTRSEGFLHSLLERARTYDEVFLSPKQQHWLTNLAAKAGVEMRGVR
jgi:hypothetical protein